MIKKVLTIVIITAVSVSLMSCGGGGKDKKDGEEADTSTTKKTNIQKRLDKYVEVKLTTDVSKFSGKEKQLLSKLFEISKIMDKIFWQQTFGNKEELLSKIDDEKVKKFAMINYGPWDRLANNEPFIDSYGKKPKGANYYPKDMTKEEFEAWDSEAKDDLYTMIRRTEEGKLEAIPYHVYFKEETGKAVKLLKEAADLAEDEGFKKYLNLRAEAMLNDEYRASDMAWLDMKTNKFDFVVGPIETYEDAFFGYKAAYEAFILVKDMEWSKRLEKYTSLLPKLQTMLPVDEKYKAETPGSSGNQLNAYEVLYYAGDCNAGSKTIAINLPNDEVVREKKGSRKLQLKNAMKAKFDKILVPISNMLIDESQRDNVTFDAFFANTMFHEVGHGLGLSYLVENKDVTVREALKSYYTSIEEGKADILGLYIIDQLYEMGELGEVDLMDYYVTFMTGIFRSSRFGVASAHGKSNMMRFYYFQEKGAFTRDDKKGTYKVNFEKMREAMKTLAEKILVIQGDGDLEKAKKWVEEDGKIKPKLQKDLDRVNDAGIPVDIVFEQGKDVLGI